jgi:small-conductance mechanosensitive channel/uncharacterized protein YecA (UPF0149 family)
MPLICNFSKRQRFALRTTIVTVVILVSAGTLFSAPETGNSPQDVIAYLNQTVVWYRQLATQQELVDEPNDAVFLNDNRQIADQAARLSFEYARVQAQWLGSHSGGNAAAAQPKTVNPQNQGLVDLAAKTNQRVTQLQQELEGQKQKLSTASGRKRTVLESEIAETESELQLANVRKDAVQTMLQFATNVTSGGSGQGELQSAIEELSHSIPALSNDAGKSDTQNLASASAPASTMTNGDSRKSEPSSIIALITDVLDLRRKLGLLDTSLALTNTLSQSAKNLRTPILNSIRELSRKGDELAAQPDSEDPAVLAQQRKEVDGLTAQFKQLSLALLPLSKQNILLDVYKRNALNWREDVHGHYSTEMKSLFLRLGILILVLGLILGASEVWRRVTFRYVTDRRRRHQFLLLRRIVIWPLMIVIVVVAFANGLSSVTTFAGLLTAGLAVALQNLILSVVGYFFLIGKFGVRVGDRIQVSGVTGDVIDIGLVRLHIIEVTSGTGQRQTGRVVAFSNAVVFQPQGGIFKQIPGTSFSWHEVSLALSLNSDYHDVEVRMLQAVNKIFNDYHEKMELQHRSMERALGDVPVNSLRPESRLRLSETGVQVVVRYPVEVESAAEIDDRVTREVLNTTGRQPSLGTVDAPPAAEVSAKAVKG